MRANRLNRMQIREQEQLNKERQREDEADERRIAASRAKTKEQYNHVASHGYGRGGAGAAAAGSNSAPGPDAEIRVYIRECDGDAAQSFRYMESEGSGPEPGSARKAPLPRIAGAQRPTSESPAAAAAGGGGGGGGGQPAAPNRGKVPRYLQQRKAEMQAEKELMQAESQRREELAKIPPGHRLVSEDEKANTLVTLEERKRELEGQLGKIPIRFDTQAIKNRRKNIEDELAQIEETRLKYSTKRPLYLPLYNA